MKTIDIKSRFHNSAGRRISRKDHGPQKKANSKAINYEISRADLANIIGCSESTIKRRLKEWGIAWLGRPKTGHWVFVKDIQ